MTSSSKPTPKSNKASTRKTRSGTPADAPGITHQEEEAKFRVTPAQLEQLAAPEAALSAYTLAARTQTPTVDTYLDDPTYGVLRHGYALRIRQTGDLVEVGLKCLVDTGTGVIRQREEFAAPVAAADMHTPDQWPHAILAMLKQMGVDHKSLRRLAVLHQARQKSIVHRADTAVPIAEWSLDNVQISPPDDAATVWQTLHELEIERLPDAAEADFGDLVDHVHRTFGLKPVATSKLQRALVARLAAHHHDHADITADMDLAEGCRLLLHIQFQAILLAEHGVRSDQDPVYVHEMRVAIRRARAALRLFGHRFRLRAVSSLQRQLKKLARVLGPVRDADVALENLRVFRRRLAKSDREAVKELRQALEKQRTQAFARLSDYLDSDDHAAFIVAFDAFCTTPGRAVAKSKAAPEERPPRQIRHTVPSIILAGFEQVRAYEVAFTGPTLPALEVFHALRIQAKYFRYSLEFMRKLLGAPGDSIIAQLKELQEHLGLLNDAHVEQFRLVEWTQLMPENPALALRARAVEASIAQLSAELPPRLAQFISPNNRNLLGAALARF